MQTLPRRDGDPEPPPDNGQHIALGCFSSYLRFLERIGSLGGVRRLALHLPVLDDRARVATIGYGARPLLRYGHLSSRERLRILSLLARIQRLDPGDGTFGDFLRAHGQSQTAVDRFWDVFVRPALNLRTDEVAARDAVFTVLTALRSGRRASELVLPVAPLGALHGEAARRALEAAGATVATGERVASLDELDADAVVVALPPAESAALLGDPEPELEHSPIVSAHLLFDRPLLRHPLAALLASDAHWVFDRGSLTGHPPKRGQYLTVVSSGAPELMELRGRELVDRLADAIVERLGSAELLWSRVSREPEATIALRPGVRRAPAGFVRDGLARAGAWTQGDGWPPTMENAVRTGVAAARAVSFNVATKVPA